MIVSIFACMRLIGQPPLPYIRPAITTITTPNSVVAVMPAPLLL